MEGEAGIKNDRDKFEKAPTVEVSPDLSDKFTIFERWLRENGTKTRKLELRDYGNEVRGCHATSEIVEDETIIEVPLKCLITVEMGKDTDIGRAIIDANLELDAPKHIFLMLYMLIDRHNPHSFFKPYYDILPPTLSNMPIFWSPEELKYLQGSYMLKQIEERNHAIAADYQSICNVVPSFNSICSLDEFKWALENNIETDGCCPNEVPVLVELKNSDPLYDAKCTYYRRDFMVPYRRIRVCVSDNENTKLLLAMLRLIESDKEDLEILLSCSGSSMYRSIRDADIAISLKNELRMLQSLVRLIDEHLRQYPTTFEEDVHRLQHGNVPLFSNERNALIQVKGEKEVLLFFRDFANTGAIGLKLRDLSEFDEFLNQVRVSKHTLIFQYCRGTVGRLLHEEIRRGDYRASHRNIDLSKPT
eukprot:gene16856-12066_t